MDFPVISIIRKLLDADEYPFLYSVITEISENVFKGIQNGIITKKRDGYYIDAAAPVRDWNHFPKPATPDISEMPTDCFFKKKILSLPDFGHKEYVFFPLETAERTKLKVEGWYFLDAAVFEKKEYEKNIFLMVDIVREAVKKISKIEDIKKLTIIDDVTGLYNTRHLFSVIKQSSLEAARYHTDFSLIFIDIDLFKQVNDTYGHLTGSKLLKEFGRQIKKLLRSADMAFRYGGDEFVIFLPHTSKENCYHVVKRLWQNIRNHVFTINETELKITASLGAASFPEDGKNYKDIIAGADKAMYNVKNRSRDGFEIA